MDKTIEDVLSKYIVQFPEAPDMLDKDIKRNVYKAMQAWASLQTPCAGWVVRPAVKWFAEQMEAALKRNDHKGGWLQDDWDELYDRIKDETKELKKECEKLYQDDEKIIKEAADVANFAMMIADIFGNEIGQTPFDESQCSDRVAVLEKENERLRFIIDNGLGNDDLIDDRIIQEL